MSSQQKFVLPEKEKVSPEISDTLTVDSASTIRVLPEMAGKAENRLAEDFQGF